MVVTKREHLDLLFTTAAIITTRHRFSKGGGIVCSLSTFRLVRFVEDVVTHALIQLHVCVR